MKPEKRHLMDDLLDDEREARREATLVAGGRILRRRRWRRAAERSFAVVAILGMAALFFQRPITPRPSGLTSVPAPPGQARSLTDAEPLALFPETPVCLVAWGDRNNRITSPSPGSNQPLSARS